MNESKDGDWIAHNYSYTPGGKAMVVDMALGGMDGTNDFDVSSVSLGQTKHLGATTNNQEYGSFISGDEQWDKKYLAFITINNKLFAQAITDESFSRSTAVDFETPDAVSTYDSSWDRDITYSTLSNSTRQPVRERFYLVVSPNLTDTFRVIPNNASIRRDYLYGKTVFQAQWNNLGYSEAQIQGYMDRYKAFGFDNLIYDSYDYSSPNKVAYSTNFKNLINHMRNSLGYDFSIYGIAQDLYNSTASYGQCTNYISHPEYPMQNSAGDYITCYTAYDGREAECTRHEYRWDVINCEIGNLSAYTNATGFFLDANSIDSKGHVDSNVNYAAKGIMWNTFNWTVYLLNKIKTNFTTGGYVFLESQGGKHELEGIADGIEGGQTTSSNQKSIVPKVPDYILNQMNKKGFIYSGYYRRYADCSDNDDCKWRETGIEVTGDYWNQTTYDKYFVEQNGIHGMQCFIDSPLPAGLNVSAEYTINYYYMCRELAKRQYYWDTVTVSYWINNQWMSLGDAIKATTTSFDDMTPFIKLNYSNGLVVYANLNSTSHTVDGYVLTKNSLYAYNSTEFLLLYNVEKYKMLAQTPNYTYIFPENGSTTFTINGGNYSVYNFDYGPADNTYSGAEGLSLESSFYTNSTTTTITTDHQILLFGTPVVYNSSGISFTADYPVDTEYTITTPAGIVGVLVYLNGVFYNKVILTEVNGGTGSVILNGAGLWEMKYFDAIYVDGDLGITSYYYGGVKLLELSTFAVEQINPTTFHIKNFGDNTYTVTLNFTFTAYNYTCEDFHGVNFVSDTETYRYYLHNGENVSCDDELKVITAKLYGVEPATDSNIITLNFTTLGIATISQNYLYETEAQTIGLYFDSDSWNVSAVTLVHNGVRYPAARIRSGEGYWYNNTVYAPLTPKWAPLSDTWETPVIEYYWEINYMNGTTEYTHIYNYTVISFQVDNCENIDTEEAAPYAFTFAIRNEENPKDLLTVNHVGIRGSYWLSDKSASKNFSYNFTPNSWGSSEAWHSFDWNQDLHEIYGFVPFYEPPPIYRFCFLRPFSMDYGIRDIYLHFDMEILYGNDSGFDNHYIMPNITILDNYEHNQEYVDIARFNSWKNENSDPNWLNRDSTYEWLDNMHYWEFYLNYYLDLNISYIPNYTYTGPGAGYWYLPDAYYWGLVNTEFHYYQEIYGLSTQTDISTAKFTIRDSNTYLYLKNAIVELQRYYDAENLWRTVAMDKTDDYGLAFFKVHEEITNYRIKVTDWSNNQLSLSLPMKFKCTNALCEIVYLVKPLTRAGASDTEIAQYYDNQTNLVYVSWQVPTNLNVSIDSYVYKVTARQNIEVCHMQNYGIAGTQTCDLSTYTGAFQVVTTKTSSLSTDRQTLLVDIPSERSFSQSLSGKLGDTKSFAEQAFWSFAIMVTISMFAVMISPVFALVASVFALIIIFSIGLLAPLTYAVLIVLIAMIMFIAFKIKS
jgi:hypothetical protein